jgi:hypothetical protein
MILALGASSRAVNVTRTALASLSVATMIDFACWALASCSTSDFVASPCTVTRPALFARSSAVAFSSTTTMSAGATSSPTIAATAVLPLVPYPMTTVWLRTLLLHRWIFNAWRDWVVSVSTVVPMSTIRNAIRSGVITSTLTSRASGLNGVMSP